MEALRKRRFASGYLRVGLLGSVLVLASGLVAGCVSPSRGESAAHELLVSRSRDRSDPTVLSGAVVRDSVYVFVSSPGSIRKAEFFLDNPAATGTPRQVEREKPFDFAGTRHSGYARYLRTTDLADGTHEITARLTLSGGATKKVSSRFRVGNRSGSTGTSSTTTTTAAPVTAPTTAAPVPTTTTTQAVAPSAPVAPSGGFPTAQSTGWRRTGVSLSPYSGPCVITVPGTVIDAKDISCSKVEVRADDVRISRSRVRASGDLGVVFRSGSGLVISDSEVTAVNPGGVGIAIASWGGRGMRVERSYVHGTVRGIQPGEGTSVSGSYVDDLVNASGAHATAVGVNGGTRNVTIRGNTLGCNASHCSAALSAYPETTWGPNDNWLIDGNLLNGGGYCTHLGYTPSAGEQPNTNFRVTNNVFGNKYYPRCGQYGPVASWTPPPTGVGNLWSGNVDASGNAVNP